jgi:hypothetical protein
VLQLGQRRSRLGFAYWERQVFDQDFRQAIVRGPTDKSAPATQLERTGRLYVDPEPGRPS